MCRILILADIRPMGISFHAVLVFGLGKNLLFKSILGRCVGLFAQISFRFIEVALNLVFLIST